MPDESHDAVFSGNTGRGEQMGREYVMSKATINGNTYLVLGYPNETYQKVIVYADPEGTDHGLPDTPMDIGSYHGFPYEHVTGDKQLARSSVTPDFATFTAGVINDAVCQVEDKQADRDDWQTSVEAALEATKATHEDIDYQLDTEPHD